MNLQIHFIALVSLASFSWTHCKNSENVTGEISLTNVKSICPECAPSSISSKGQQWITMEKNLKNLISYASRKIMRKFDPEDALKISPRCFASIAKVAVGIKKLKMWAFRFFDAMGKIPDGMGSGTLTALGDFDGCLNINVTGSFQGKSCILEFTPPLPKVLPGGIISEDIPELRSHFPPDTVIGSITSEMKLHFDKLVIRQAVCVPSTCTQDDVKFIAEKALKATNIFPGIEVEVPYCQVKEKIKFQKWDEYTSLIVIGLLIMLVIIGTLTDITKVRFAQSNEENFRYFIRILLCFSIYRNTEKLLKQSQTSSTISVFNGIRAVTTMWIVLGHAYSFIPYQILHGSVFVRNVSKSFSFQVVLNAYPAVDTFFFMGGTILMYSWLKAKERNIPIFMYIFKRYWRFPGRKTYS